MTNKMVFSLRALAASWQQQHVCEVLGTNSMSVVNWTVTLERARSRAVNSQLRKNARYLA